MKVEIKRTPDGRTLARRDDGKPLTPGNREAVRKVLDATDDPVVSADDWYPAFRDFYHNVVREIPDFDYIELRQNRPDLYRAIKAKEAEIDVLQSARLSEVIAIMTEWRRLMLLAYRERIQPTEEGRL